MGIPSSRRTDTTDDSGLPRVETRLPAKRKESALVGEGFRMTVCRNKTLRLVPRLSRWRPLTDVGTSNLPLERSRFRGQCQGRPWCGLANSLQRHRTLVYSRREIRRYSGIL